MCICVFVHHMTTRIRFAGVSSVSVDVGEERVLVESSLTSAEVQALIEGTGRRAVLKGIGGSEHGERKPTGARLKTPPHH